MAITRAPSVFVSSTCYDLAQVRQDLRAFIELLGMNPILSEFSSFPVNPNLDAIGNCLAGVKENADILVLVVGGRYGSRPESGKSVTNMEYLEGKAKGIPCYVFVQKPILTSLPIWQRNPTADFSNIVDSPQLFEFVDSLRDPKQNWVFPFESAQDIIETLRKQLAYLFMDSLSLRTKVINCGISESLRDLSATAMLFVIQKPFVWENRLFSQVLADELNRLNTLKMDVNYGIVFRQVVRIDADKVMSWIQQKANEILLIIQSVNTLINVALLKAMGAQGEPGNAEQIVYVAKRLAGVYRSILEWTADFKHVQVDERFTKLIAITSHLSANVISEFEQFSSQSQHLLPEAVSQYETTHKPITLEMQLNLTCPDLTDFENEIKQVAQSFGIEYAP